jgi:hypothetical protein
MSERQVFRYSKTRLPNKEISVKSTLMCCVVDPLEGSTGTHISVDFTYT